MTRLEGKTALVTGAGSGIGRSVARRFAREGARVVIADRDEHAARRAVEEIGAAARAQVMDIAQESSVAEAFAGLGEAGWTPDVVIANAGVQLFGRDAKIADLDLEAWNDTIGTNLTGAFLTVKHAIRVMLPRGGGSIVLTGSPTAFGGQEGADFTAYSTSKAGIHGLARFAAAGYADQNIRVNVVVPAYTETGLVSTISEDSDARAEIISRIPLGRAGRAEDVEGIMTFLASDDAAFATGGLFAVDGGMSSL